MGVFPVLWKAIPTSMSHGRNFVPQPVTYLDRRPPRQVSLREDVRQVGISSPPHREKTCHTWRRIYQLQNFMNHWLFYINAWNHSLPIFIIYFMERAHLSCCVRSRLSIGCFFHRPFSENSINSLYIRLQTSLHKHFLVIPPVFSANARPTSITIISPSRPNWPSKPPLAAATLLSPHPHLVHSNIMYIDRLPVYFQSNLRTAAFHLSSILSKLHSKSPGKGSSQTLP